MTIRGRSLSPEAAQSVSKDSRSRAVPNPVRLKRFAVGPSPAATNDDLIAVICFEDNRPKMCLSFEKSSASARSQSGPVSGSLMGTLERERLPKIDMQEGFTPLITPLGV